MIDTKELREWTQLVGDLSIAEKRKLSKDIIAIADELDRLYLDHAPLSREELETVLKEEGCKKRGNSITSHNNCRGYLITEKEFKIIHSGVYILIIPLSAVTRATLRSCGVIK